MRVVIVGAGSTGRELARRVSARHEVVLIDTEAAKLDSLTGELDEVESEAELETLPLQVVRGDGTSRIQLQRTFSTRRHTALVAAGGSDEVNLETGRIARDIGYDPVLALQHERASADAYAAEGITALERAQILADHLERSLEHKGAVIPAGIGLGRGELIEVRLVSTSPVLGRPLKDMAPESWRIAAVFRGDDLIVPTGETTLQVEDRVLLVGEPDLLDGVADYIRTGTPQFPRPYGTTVLSLERDGSDAALCEEARGLAAACDHAEWVRCVAGTTRGGDEPAPREDGPSPTRLVGLSSFDDDDLLDRIRAEHPGVVVTRPFQRGLGARILGRRGADAWLCDNLPAPLLFARGSFPYHRILLPVSASRLAVDAAELAIDLTRRISASLTAVNVDLPRYISGEPEEALHEEVVPIKRLCQLYEVPLDYRHHLGNPIQRLLHEAEDHDLIVMARRRRRKDTYFAPDVALRVAREAHCSVLVLTAARRR